MQLKRQSVEAWQKGKHYSNGIIPSRTQSQDKKFQISQPCEVGRSGQVTTFIVYAVFSLSFPAYGNCYKSSGFSIKSEMSGWI